VKHIREMAEADYEKYDIIHVNLCGCNAPLIPKIKETIKNSSTVLITNPDYAVENFQEGFAKPKDFYLALKAADFVFCQDPWQLKFMSFMFKHHIKDGKEPAFVPHPCDTAGLKRLKIGYDQRMDLIGVMYHRYRNELLLPSLVSWGLKYSTILFGLTSGNIPVGLFHFTSPMIDWKRYFYVLVHCTLALDYISMYHCMGRFTMETACLGTPTVCTDRIYTGLKLFPSVCHDPMDFEGIRGSLQKLIDDEEFYHQVADYAYEHVEEFNWENSKKRLLEEMEKRGIHIK